MLQASFGAYLEGFISRRSKETVLLISVCLVLLIGLCDYLVPYAISMMIFYVPPILLAVRYAEKRSGDLVAIIAVIVSWWTDELTAPPSMLGWIHTYKMCVRLMIFLFISMGASALKSRRDHAAEQRESDRKQIELLERSQRLEREIIRISEREKRRIGQDLHDGLCQYLAAITCAASSLKSDLKQLSLTRETEAAAEIAELLKQAVTQTRNVARGLSPVHTDEAGLESALHELTTNASGLLNIDCRFESMGHVPIYDNIAATHLYRIAQEALNNATRHGKATRVIISLKDEGGTVSLSIADNGIGMCNPKHSSKGMGQKVMDYRARVVGGELSITNNPDGGVQVTCTFPQKPHKATSDAGKTAAMEKPASAPKQVYTNSDAPVSGSLSLETAQAKAVG